MNKLNKGVFSSEKSDWATPISLFRKLDNEFHFTLDVCANEENAKCKHFYSEDDNGLIQPWGGNRCWCNPPYGNQYPKWVLKGYKEVLMNKITVVYLLPARTDTVAFHQHIMTAADEIRFIKGRVRFSGAGPAPFPSMVVVMRPNRRDTPKISTLVVPRT